MEAMTTAPKDMKPLSQLSRPELAALYDDWIGYDPFADSPSLTDDEVRQTLREYVAECIVVSPEQDDAGKTVYAWSVMSGEETVAGGYCATEADARSDAETYILESI